MRTRYLEITYRKGKPLAAYLYLARDTGVKSLKTVSFGKGLVVDYGLNDTPIGIEISAPGQISLEDINKVLHHHGLDRLTQEELAPLRAA